jgi:predicted extracellular nuclease
VFSITALATSSLLPTVPVTTLTGGLILETTAATATAQLSVTSFNVENLDPQDAPDKFRRLAEQIVHNLKSLDILGLMEVQDNNGAVNDGMVDANVTFNRLISAIQAAGGPGYQFRSIDPVDGQDGGEPGGNIRVGSLFNPARVTFVDPPGGSSTSTTTVVGGAQGIALSASPGRLDPLNPAFTRSRKPLVGEFLFDGHTLFIIANHFNSKGGDQPLFGHHQPPARPSEAQRRQQAQVVSDSVQAILARDPNANVVVLGDLNDFEFLDTLGILKSAGLTDIVETLPPEERYTYVFEGNSQVLDHILVSPNLMHNAAVEYDVVHVNAEFAEQVSDHDPEVARIRF